MKKTITIGILLASLSGILGIGVFPAILPIDINPTPSVANAASEEITIGECLEGDLEFMTFLQTIIGWKGWDDSFVEYWKDIFGRNQCQSYDILLLDNQQDKIKQRIQDAFLTCERYKIPNLKKSYYRLDAEIYFVRRLTTASFLNVFNNSLVEPVTFGLSNQNDTMANIPQNNVKLQDTKEVYKKMLPRYVQFFENEEAFKEFFENLEYKYRVRKFNYIDCPHTFGWQAVNDKVNEFIESWGGTKDGVDYFVKSTSDETERWDRSANANTYTSFGDLLGNQYDININNLPPEEGWADFEDFMSERSSSVFDKDLNSMFDQLGSASASYQYQLERAKLVSKYESLYLLNTDAAIAEFLGGLDELNTILNDSTVYLDHTVSCSNSIIYKQCKK